MAEMWDDLVPHNPTVTCRGISRHPPIDIDGEPVLQILRHGHLRGIDLRALDCLIEQAGKLRLGLTPGAPERDVPNSTLAGDRVTAQVELQFPTSFAPLPDMALALVTHCVGSVSS